MSRNCAYFIVTISNFEDESSSDRTKDLLPFQLLFKFQVFKRLRDLEGELRHSDAVDVADQGDDDAIWHQNCKTFCHTKGPCRGALFTRGRRNTSVG